MKDPTDFLLKIIEADGDIITYLLEYIESTQFKGCDAILTSVLSYQFTKAKKMMEFEE